MQRGQRGTDDVCARQDAPEAKALVQLSRSFDRGGGLGFVTFILPLILDGIFHGALPKLFAPNSLALLQNPDLKFEQIRTLAAQHHCWE